MSRLLRVQTNEQQDLMEPGIRGGCSDIGCEDVDDTSMVLLTPRRRHVIQAFTGGDLRSRLRPYRISLFGLASSALLFGLAMPLAHLLNSRTAPSALRSGGVVSSSTDLHALKRAGAFNKCAGQATSKDEEQYAGCEVGCICEEVNQYYSQCTPPGEENVCSKEGAMPMVKASKAKYDKAHEDAKKARGRKIYFHKEASKAAGAAKYFREERKKAEGSAKWWREQAAKAANAGGFPDVTPDNVLEKAQYIRDTSNKASGHAEFLRGKANVAAEKAKGNYPPTACAKAFGACSDGAKCCQDGCVCTAKDAAYSQCLIPSGFNSCRAAAASAAQVEAKTTDQAASGAEQDANAKQHAAQQVTSMQDNQNKANAAIQKSKEMDDAEVKAKEKDEQMRIASEKASKLEIHLHKSYVKWDMAVKVAKGEGDGADDDAKDGAKAKAKGDGEGGRGEKDDEDDDDEDKEDKEDEEDEEGEEGEENERDEKDEEEDTDGSDGTEEEGEGDEEEAREDAGDEEDEEAEGNEDGAGKGSHKDAEEDKENFPVVNGQMING